MVKYKELYIKNNAAVSSSLVPLTGMFYVQEKGGEECVSGS